MRRQDERHEACSPHSVFDWPAQRPLRATLDTTRLQAVFGERPRPWREALDEILADLAAAESAA